MKDLKEIGFYTLSNKRALNASITSDLQRCELILTDRCNFKCPYCRGLDSNLRGDMPLEQAHYTVDLWLKDNLKNVRFSGGEPTLYTGLPELVEKCRDGGVEHIAVSTNGSAKIELYDRLLAAGVNDFSISLDGGCCSVGDEMAGVAGTWDKVISTIRYLSEKTYVTVGMVFTEANVDQCVESVMFADSLGVSDVRVIPAAQYNKALSKLKDLPIAVLDKFPILKYRIANLNAEQHVRGMEERQCYACWLMLDDMAVAQEYHFPCIIYMREGGAPVGKVGPQMRQERLEWVLKNDPTKNPICSKMCLDVCVDYNTVADQSRQK